ncbi:MAG: NADH-quinone oxidoreductase subunit NuoE [Kiloniellales bacterium]
MSRGDTKAASFELTAENLARADTVIAKYPQGRQQSAVLAVLDLCQRQNGGWLTQAAIEYAARLLDMPEIRVHEVATFYSMLKLRPVGRHLVNVCTTTPCWLRGSDDIVRACEQTLGIELGETTADGKFTLGEVECLGACVNAPVLQVDEAYYEDLDAGTAAAVLKAFKRGKPPPPGSQTGRQGSCPIGGATTLKDLRFSEGG